MQQWHTSTSNIAANLIHAKYVPILQIVNKLLKTSNVNFYYTVNIVFGKAVQCLSKVGDELYLQVNENGVSVKFESKHLSFVLIIQTCRGKSK